MAETRAVKLQVSFPSGEHSMRCPRCGREATFNRPFTVLLSPEQGEALRREDPRVHLAPWSRSSDSLVLVHFPDLIPWEPLPPGAGYSYDAWGVCTCPHCLYRRKHERRWPQDAYFVCEVRGRVLWAWDRKHAVLLKDFIASHKRTRPWGSYWLALRQTPKFFLLGKHRALVVEKLERMLAEL